MKNSKLTKIFVLVITLALALGAVIGITAQAEDTSAATTTPTIIGKNIAYKGSFNLMFAVDESTASASSQLELYAKNEETGELEIIGTYDHAGVETPTINGEATPAYVFTTGGIPAKYMAKNYYAKVVDSGNGTESAVIRYSVAEYLYERLYVDNIISATPSDVKALNEDYVRKNFYLNILEFGASAEDLLFNYNTDENGSYDEADDIDSFVTDANYVAVVGGTVDGTYSAGAYPKGTILTLNYTEESATKSFGGTWTVTTYETADNGELVINKKIVNDGASFVVEATTVAEANCLELKQGNSFDDGTTGTQIVTTDLTACPEGFVTQGVVASPAPKYDGDLSYEMTLDATVADTDTQTKSGVTFRNYLDDKAEGAGTLYVFEYDTYVDGAATVELPAQMFFRGIKYKADGTSSDWDGAPVAAIQVVHKDSGWTFQHNMSAKYSCPTNDQSALAPVPVSDTLIPYSEWVRIRMELYAVYDASVKDSTGNGTYTTNLKVFVNDVWYGDIVVTYTGSDAADCIKYLDLVTLKGATGTAYYDNVSFYSTVGTYSEGNPVAADEYDGAESFDLWYNGNTQITDNVTVLNTTTASVELDPVNSDPALHITAAGDGNGFTVDFLDNTQDENADSCYVFETDLYILPTATSNMSVLFKGEDSTFARIDLNLNCWPNVGFYIYVNEQADYNGLDGVTYAGKNNHATFITSDKMATGATTLWVTVRFELYKIYDGEGVLTTYTKVYINDTYCCTVDAAKVTDGVINDVDITSVRLTKFSASSKLEFYADNIKAIKNDDAYVAE